MATFLDIPAVKTWSESAIRRNSGRPFGNLVAGVIWSDARGEDGELLVPLDPVDYVARHNSDWQLLLNGHDPGRPLGQVLEAAHFESDSGEQFIVAILALYAGSDVLNFKDLGIDTTKRNSPPAQLPTLPGGLWIELATDPREIEFEWLDRVSEQAPLPIKRTELSHNAAEAPHELIGVGLLFMTLAWAPFLTSVASEAGKDTYASIRKWLGSLVEKLSDRRNPVLDIHSHHNGCQVSFLIRGKEVKPNTDALEAITDAASQAESLISKLKKQGAAPKKLVYEFDKKASLWYPSYAILHDDRILTDSVELLAIEKLPRSISIGLKRGPLPPTLKSLDKDNAPDSSGD